MSNIVIAFSKPEVAAGIKKILTQSGYSVQAVCTTGAQALASVNNLECGILICGCRFIGYDVYGNSRLSATGVSDASDRFSVFHSGERGKQSGLSFHADESA